MYYLEKEIILVDDEPMILKSLKREMDLYCIEKEITVKTFTSGKDALEYLENNHKNVFLVITDLRMPEINGTDLLRNIKNIYPQIKLFLLTAYSDIAEIQKAIKTSIDRLIIKPWDSISLQTDIENTLKTFQLEKENRELQDEKEINLALAADFQKKLLPPTSSSNNDLDLNIIYTPTANLNCGGDYYDYFDIDDKKVIMIGDVAGHGIKPAFVTSMLKVLTTLKKSELYRQREISASEILSYINKGLINTLSNINEIIATFTVAIVDNKEKTLSIAGAGELPVYIIRDNDIITLKDENVAMGFIHDTNYSDRKIKIESNDLILMFTDGLIESEKTKLVVDGQRIKSLMLTLDLKNEPTTKIYNAFKKIHQDNFDDDVTIITARIL